MTGGRKMPDRATCEALDRDDPLAHLRQAFVLPEGLIYLDGNSLGPLPRLARERLQTATDHEWGVGLIRSWNAAGWIEAPRRLGDKIAPLIGARKGEVVVADSTSINVFKLLAGALRLRPERRTILSEAGNFPTDLYMAQGLIDALGGRHRLRYAEGAAVADAIDSDTAVVLLTHVNFKTGWMHDMAGMTRAAHAAGALILWDLAHSAGAVPVDLEGAGADLAVGCSYKYLNGGPGAPAFLYIRSALQPDFPATLSGWMGHAAPFAFDPAYTPAAGIARQLCGTPPILALAALEAALDVWSTVDMAAVRKKSVALCDLFIARVEQACAGYDLSLVSPRDAARRGSQVSFAHPEGYAIMQALIARGVIGDFRAPDVMRFGFTPLYTRFVDAWDAAVVLAEVLATRAWDSTEHRVRAHVT
jgi:kynureninase